jgi:hypothetical protein
MADQQYEAESPEVIAMHRKALQISGELRRFFRIEVKAEDSPISTVHKLLRKIGRRGEQVSQPRRHRRGQKKRPRIYRIAAASEQHQRFLQSARRKALAGRHTVCNEAKKSPIANRVPAPKMLAQQRIQPMGDGIHPIQFGILPR